MFVFATIHKNDSSNHSVNSDIGNAFPHALADVAGGDSAGDDFSDGAGGGDGDGADGSDDDDDDDGDGSDDDDDDDGK